MSLVTDRNDPKLKKGQTNTTGQHEVYLVLSEEERAKGFVRPLRFTYTHAGRSVCGAFLDPRHIRDRKDCWDICAQKLSHKGPCGSPFYGDLLPSEATQIHSTHRKGGCGVATKMGQALSETYARDPSFYGATFCVGCNVHLPVDEFVWDDGQPLGS